MFAKIPNKTRIAVQTAFQMRQFNSTAINCRNAMMLPSNTKSTAVQKNNLAGQSKTVNFN